METALRSCLAFHVKFSVTVLYPHPGIFKRIPRTSYGPKNASDRAGADLESGLGTGL